MYTLLRDGRGWPGEPLQLEENGYPHIQDILERLEVEQPSIGGEHMEEPVGHMNTSDNELSGVSGLSGMS